MPADIFFALIMLSLSMILVATLLIVKKAYEASPILGAATLLIPPVLIFFTVTSFSKIRTETYLYSIGVFTLALLFFIV